MKILFYVIIALQLLTLFSCANEQLVGHWEQDKNSIMDNGGESMVFLKQSSKDNDELFNKIATYIKTPEDIKQEIEQLLKLEP